MNGLVDKVLTPKDIVGNMCVVGSPYKEHLQYNGKVGRVINMSNNGDSYEMIMVSGKKVSFYPEELLHLVDKEFIYCRVCNSSHDFYKKKPWQECGKCFMNHKTL